ncbi:serine hydrolase [candidate division KSB1 bacterium]|nr:serine hydrolase [candidate division KSB1 bacterium]
MKKTVFSIFIIFLLYTSCKHKPVHHYTYRPPENINDGFDTGTLSEVNINPALIENAVDSINRGNYKEVHSMLIFKDGKLVFEEYFKGHKHDYFGENHHGELVTWDRAMPHYIMSVTKSITSVCIGIAIDKGLIKNVHESIFDYLPDYRRFNTDGKDKITIEHLLSMTAGYAWNERALPYGNLKNDIMMLYQVEDPVTFILNKPQLDEPGKNFNYAGGSNILLGEILRNATKMNIIEFGGKYLFGPLGINTYDWPQYKNGVVDAAGGLKIRPRDMAKIGVTFLNKGVWNGKRIISEQWVEKSAESFPGNSFLNNWDDDWGMKGYSYSWWTHMFTFAGKKIEMFYAGGWGGQYIMVIPELNMVIVFTGANYTSFRPPFTILKKYIIPAYIQG